MTAAAAETLPAAAGAGARPRSAFAGAWLLSGATLASGALTYAFHVLAGRALGVEAYGGIAVLWAAIFLVVIVFFRPLEQTMSRSVAYRLAGGQEASTVLRSVILLAVGLLLALAAAGLAGWQLVSERLFLGDALLTAMLFAGIVAYGASYLARGLLAGCGWFAGYGLCLLVDSVARLAIAAPLVVIASKDFAAGAIVGAGLLGAAVPLYLGRRRLRESLTGVGRSRFRLGAALGFAAPASVIAGVDQLLVNGGPLLVMLGGGEGAAKAAGLIFAATMLVRIPVFLFQGLATSLLPNLTRLQLADEQAFRQAIARAVSVLLAAGALVVAAAAVAGPEAMQIMFGASFDAGRRELVMLAAGVGFYLGASTCSQALLALDRGRVAAAGWLGSAGVFVLLFYLLDAGSLMRVAVAFAAASASALLLLGIPLARAAIRARRVALQHPDAQ